MIVGAIVILKLTYFDTRVHRCHGVPHEFAHHLCMCTVILHKDKDGENLLKILWDFFCSCGLQNKTGKNYHCLLKWPKPYILCGLHMQLQQNDTAGNCRCCPKVTVTAGLHPTFALSLILTIFYRGSSVKLNFIETLSCMHVKVQ